MKLEAKKREIVGKKSKLLRAEGLVPATVYGPNKESANIQFSEKEFQKIFRETGFNRFIELEVEGGKPSKVLVKEMHMHPLKDYVESVGLYEVDEKRRVTVDIPIEIEGESPAVKANLGFLVNQITDITIYALPKDVPTHLTISLDSLEEPGDTVSVSDIDLPEGVELASSMDASSAIVYVGIDQKEEEVEEVEGEGEEGEEGAEGEEGSQGEEGKEKGSDEEGGEGEKKEKD